MTKQTPVEIATKHFENYYIKDNELQKRYDGYKIEAERHEKILPELNDRLMSAMSDKTNLEELIIKNALSYQTSVDINRKYLRAVEVFEKALTDYDETKKAAHVAREHVKQLENLTFHKMMVAWNIISSLDPAIKKAGFPEWKKKYEGKII